MKKILLFPALLFSFSVFAQSGYAVRASWKEGAEMKKYEQFLLFNPLSKSFAYSDYNKKLRSYEVLKGIYSVDGEYITFYYDDRATLKIKFYHTEEYDYILLGKKKFLLKSVI